MSLLSRIGDLITAIGADVKDLQTQIDALGPSGVTTVFAHLAADLPNSTNTPAVITGFTFTIPAGKKMKLDYQGLGYSAATTTGVCIGARISQPSGANGNAQGSVVCEQSISSGAAASALKSGRDMNVAANANSLFELVGTAVSGTGSSARHFGQIGVMIENKATNADTTVTIEFRSETNGTAVNIMAHAMAVGIIF